LTRAARTRHDFAGYPRITDDATIARNPCHVDQSGAGIDGRKGLTRGLTEAGYRLTGEGFIDEG
jgi:hypothetical protein